MQTYDLIIIGGGPAGYVGAIRAAQLGMNVALVEKNKMGGMCLNWGCIPSKAYIETAKLFARLAKAKSFGIEGVKAKDIMVNWKKMVSRKDRIVMRLVKGVEYLMKKNKVTIINGEARFTGKDKIQVSESEYSADKFLICTGSRPEEFPYADKVDEKKLVEIDQFFTLNEVPDNFLIDGFSVNAAEIAQMLKLIGKEVTVFTDREEFVFYLDESLREFVTDKFKKSGIKIFTNATVTKDAKDGVYLGDEFVKCDMIINSRHRLPVLPDLGPNELELERGAIKTDEFMQSSSENIYAAGDVAGQYFAQTASAMATVAVNHMNGIKQKLDLSKMPRNIYTFPEMATAGMTEEELKQKGIEYKVGKFPLSVNGKAMIEGETEGFVKILSETKYGEVMGVHIVAPDATDMIAEAVMAMSLESTVEDVAQVVHAHPTVSETMLEAAFVAEDKPVHI